MRSLSGLLLILFMLFNLSSFAQSGCLVATNNTVYTTQEDNALVNAVLVAIFGGDPVYKPNPNEPSISACVSNSQTRWVATAQNCRVCPLGYSGVPGVVVTGCQTATYMGKVASRTIVQCNLDDYSWLLAAVTGAFSFLFIKRQIIYLQIAEL